MKKFLIKAITLTLFAALLFGSVTAVYAGGSSSRTSSSPVTITLLLLGTNPTNSRHAAALDRINAITRDRIGATLRTRYIEWADWENQYQLALATQDPTLDLVTAGTDWLYTWEITRRGGFYGLTPQLLQANAPITWREVTPSHWDLCSEDGKIWFIPEDQFSQYTNHGMYWRLDWAREGGLNSVDRFEDLERYWDIVKRNHPEAYPWDASASGMGENRRSLVWAYMQGKRPIQLIIGANAGNYGIFQYNTNDPYTVISTYMDGNELIEAAVIMQRFAQKGFWREDVLNYSGDTQALMRSGLSGSDQHHTQSYLGVRQEMDKDQPGSELQMYWYGKENNNVVKDLISHGAMAINAATRNVEKSLQMYDLLRNDYEIYTLYNYGIENRDYVVTRPWTPTRPALFARPQGYNSYTDGLESNFWGGRVDKFEPEWDDWWTGRTAFVQNLNSFAMDYALEKFSFDNSRVSTEMAAISDVCASILPAIHFGKTANPERAVAEFRAALQRAGYDRVKAELQSQLTAARNR